MGKVEEGLAEAIRSKQKFADESCYTLTIPASTIAKIHLMKEDYHSALEEVDYGLQLVEKNEERVHEAELWRIRAVALSKISGEDTDPASAFEESLSIAEEMKIPLWKFRTLHSMYEFYKEDDAKKQFVKAELQKHIEEYPESEGFKEYAVTVKLLNE